MALRTVGLPTPAEMKPRWAAYAALLAVRGERWAQGAHATAHGWHYDDGGGNWADVVSAGSGRAVLVGHDHEYSETYFREGATYFGEEETDLLADAPDWWEAAIVPYLDRQRTAGMWIGFIYGFDGRWMRSDYDADDGFTSVGLPFTDDETTGDALVDRHRGVIADPGPRRHDADADPLQPGALGVVDTEPQQHDGVGPPAGGQLGEERAPGRGVAQVVEQHVAPGLAHHVGQALQRRPEPPPRQVRDDDGDPPRGAPREAGGIRADDVLQGARGLPHAGAGGLGDVGVIAERA